MDEADNICSKDELLFPVNCKEWCDFFETNDNTNNHSTCCTIMCFPIKFPINLLFCSSCTLFNIFCNKYHKTTDKSYLC